MTLRVLNPDFELTEYEYGGTLEIDGKKCENPFSLGQTIVAFAKNSAGQPSWIKRAADAVAGQEDEHNPASPPTRSNGWRNRPRSRVRFPQGRK